MIPAGDLRHRVQIETPNSVENELGEIERAADSNWSFFHEVWASVEPLSSREAMYAKQNGSSVTHKVRMRYFSGLNSKMRIRWQQSDGVMRTLAISSIKNVNERNIEWELQTTEQRPYGS